MKKFKKLIPAFCMLLVSAIMLGSSTFAWFSMNDKVTASGMQVSAKSTQTFLLISSTNKTADAIQTENAITTTLTVSDTEAAVLPSAWEGITNTATATTLTVGESKWYTAFGSDPTKPDMKVDTKRELTSFDGYVIHKQVWLTLSLNSANVKNLKVSAEISSKTGKNITPARVLVTSEKTSALLKSDTLTPAADLLGSEELAVGTVVELNIFIYIDGTDAAVYTNNYANLDTAKIDLKFAVDLA